MVEIQGLKPWTSALPGQRSNQLSYIPTLLTRGYFTRFIPKNKAVTIVHMLADYLEDLAYRAKAQYYAFTVGGGIILLGLTGWMWWHYHYLNPQTVFWGAVNNNLVVSGVTKHTTSQNEAGNLSQYDQISFGANNVVKTSSTVTQNPQDAQKSVVVTESIGMPTQNFARYTKIEGSSTDGKKPDFGKILNVWSKQTVDQDNNGVFADAIFDAIPFALLSQKNRQDVVNSMQTNQVYDIDFSDVKKERKDGKLLYTYQAAIAADKYVAMLKQVDSLMGLKQLSVLDPSQYQGSQPIQVQFTVDAVGHQLAAVEYTGTNRKIAYSSWGVPLKLQLPDAKLTRSELQTKLNDAVGQ